MSQILNRRYLNMICHALLIILLSLLSAPSFVMAEDHAGSYLNELIGDARRLKLADQRYWDLLLHYRQRGGGRESRVDDPHFFLAATGKTDPAAELEATLMSFFAGASGGREHARCRFVARYAWLKDQLSMDESRLPAASCYDLDNMLSAVNPRSVVLVYPVAYINSPASMFGHTLLRIDGGSESTLISLAVNYAAVTAESGGLSYALNGIFGGYRGYYTALPYYDKVREYSSIENRDIWEYSLNLTPDETRRLVLHLWELRGIYSEYYFIDENCSYQVLYLLEVARPSVRLIDAFESPAQLWVLPGDTVQVLVDSGMVTAAVYRPSQATRIRAIAAALSPDLRTLAHRMANGEVTAGAVDAGGMPEQDRMRVLDLAAEHIQYLAVQHQITSGEYESRFSGVLHQRNEFSAKPGAQVPIPALARPDEGHLPARAALGGGCRTGSCFGELGVRPGYHDLMDDDRGYAEGSQISVLHTVFRYSNDDHGFRLHSLRLVDMMSISPRDLFFRPLAWKAGLGVEQKLIPGGNERLVTDVVGGAGLAVRIGSTIGYALAEAELNMSSSFQDNASLGAGGSVGMLVPVARWWKLGCTIRGLAPLLGNPYRTMKGEIAQNFTVSRNNSVSVIVSREETSGNLLSEGRAFMNFYF